MEEPIYKVKIRTGSYEKVSGFIDFQLAGGYEKVFTFKPEEGYSDLYVFFTGYIYDSENKVCGINISMSTEENEREKFEIHEGETLKQGVWTTTVDDDGCPEDTRIFYEITLYPINDAPEDGIKSI